MIDDGIYRVVKGGRGFGFYVVRPATDTEYRNLNERVVVNDGPFTTREQAQARADELNEQRARILAAKPSGLLLVLRPDPTDDGDEAA